MSLLHLGVGQQLRGVGLEQLGQMRRQHGRGVDHRVALHRRFFLLRDVDPGRRQAEGRLGGVQAGQLHLRAGRVHDHVLARPDPAGAGLDLLDLDDVAVGLELDVVEDAHRRHHEAHLDRERAPQRLDLLGEAVGAVGRIDQRQQRVAELDLEIVDLERRRDRLVGRRAFLGLDLFRLDRQRELLLLVHDVGERARAAAEQQERQHRNAGQQRHDHHHRARHAERLGIVRQLPQHRLVGGAADAGLGDEQARGGRDDQRRDLRDQAVADREQRVGAAGLGEATGPAARCR